MLYRDPNFYDKNNVHALLGVEATHIDTDTRTVETSDRRSLGFDRLLIAIGGKPVIPRDVTGTDAQGVFTLTTWDDARSIQDFIETNAVQEAVVVGGGLIGLKSMEALVELGIKTTVVELAGRILSTTLDEAASALACEHLEKAGVELCCGTTVSRIVEEDGKVAGAVLRGNKEVRCGLVVFAIGVVPSTDIVAGTDIEVDRGILVDEMMQRSAQGIYAAGDVVEITDLVTGQKRPISILPNAYRQGLIAGYNMAGKKRTYRGGMIMNSVDILGLPTISVGITSATGDGYEMLSTFDATRPSYKKIVLRDDKVVGAVFVGEIERAGIITGLIKEGISVSSFKDLLLTEQFGLISLPADYRKHVVSGMGIEV